MTYRLDQFGQIKETLPDPIWDNKPGVVDAAWMGDGTPESMKHARACRDMEAKTLRDGGWEVVNVGPCIDGPAGPTIGYFVSAWKSRRAHERWRGRARR
jgi:hypothetical protein